MRSVKDLRMNFHAEACRFYFRHDLFCRVFQIFKTFLIISL